MALNLTFCVPCAKMVYNCTCTRSNSSGASVSKVSPDETEEPDSKQKDEPDSKQKDETHEEWEDSLAYHQWQACHATTFLAITLAT